MKGIINLIGVTAIMGIGMNAGFWIWENILEDKVDNLKDNVTKKFNKETEGA